MYNVNRKKQDMHFRLRNDLYCVGWGVKLYTHSLTLPYSYRLLLEILIDFQSSFPTRLSAKFAKIITIHPTIP